MYTYALVCKKELFMRSKLLYLCPGLLLRFDANLLDLKVAYQINEITFILAYHSYKN